MRVGFVLAAGVMVVACASIVDLDHVDTGSASSGDDDDTQASSGTSGNQSSGKPPSGSSTSGAASSSSGAEAGADSGGPRVNVTTCTKQEDCAQNDGDHDRCTNKGECKDTCVKEGTPCLGSVGDLPCCIGLVCRRPDLGGVVDLCQPPK